jgi:hypothetical protein
VRCAGVYIVVRCSVVWYGMELYCTVCQGVFIPAFLNIYVLITGRFDTIGFLFK